MTLTLTSYQLQPGNGLVLTLTDTSTGNTGTLTLEERSEGASVLENNTEMIVRLVKQVCSLVTALNATPTTTLDSGS